MERHPTRRPPGPRGRDRRGLRGLLPLLLLPLLASGALGCLHDPSVGPLFRESPSPHPGHARVYLYRLDPHHSFSMVEIRFDAGEPLHVLDEEYVTTELEEGTHEITFRLRRRLGWPGARWSTQRIRAREGETIYFEIAVGVEERTPPSGRELEIAGRSGVGTTGEVVTIRLTPESEARERIRMTHRHVP